MGPGLANAQPLGWAVNPPRLQILRIDKEGRVDEVIMNGIWCHLCKKYLLTPIITNLRWHWQNAQKSCNFFWVIFELIGLLLLQWHARVYEETLNVNIKITQTMQNTWNYFSPWTGSLFTGYLKFYCWKVESTEEIENFGDYPGDFRL